MSRRVLPLMAGLLAGAGAYHALQSNFQKEFSELQKSLRKMDSDLKPPFVCRIAHLTSLLALTINDFTKW